MMVFVDDRNSNSKDYYARVPLELEVVAVVGGLVELLVKELPHFHTKSSALIWP